MVSIPCIEAGDTLQFGIGTRSGDMVCTTEFFFDNNSVIDGERIVTTNVINETQPDVTIRDGMITFTIEDDGR